MGRLAEPWHWQERFDQYYYDLAARLNLWIPKILGTDIRQLGLRLTLDAAMLGVGGLMGIRVATSVLLGALVNFAVLAPIMIQRGDIAPTPRPTARWSPSRARDREPVVALVGRDDDGGGRAGRACSPSPRSSPRRSRRSRRRRTRDGTPPIRCATSRCRSGSRSSASRSSASSARDHAPVLRRAVAARFISLPLIFLLTVICTNSMALTSWTPTGALSKITQFTMGAIDRVNPATNLIPATMTAEIASNASNLLSDIKPGYMLGAKPRQQAIGHFIGILAGTLATVPLFFLLFLPPEPDGARSPSTIVSEQFAMPAAIQWKGVADLITNGLSQLPTSAVISMIVAAILPPCSRWRAFARRAASRSPRCRSDWASCCRPSRASRCGWAR